MVIFSCLPEVARERITKDLKAEIQRADSIKFIDEQYEQYLHTMDILDDEKYFYRMIQKRK
jgi:hypothetical protein